MNVQKILAAVMLVIVTAVLFLEWRSPLLSALIRGRPVEILILGLDEAEGTRRADTIMLARLEAAPARLKILQIPRDTLVRFGNSTRKINSLYERGGTAAIAQAVSEFSSSTVRYFAVFDYSSFGQIYEALGDSEQALGFVRSRNEEGDLGRLTSQRDFYAMSLSRIALEPWRLFLLMKRGALNRTFKSNIAVWEMAALIWRLRSWSSASHIYYFPLPGTPDEKGNFKASPVLWAATHPWWEGTGGANALKVRPVRLEVLNASGQPGLASRWTRLLRSFSEELPYDVLYFGNASGEPRETSVLVTRQADLYLAKQTLVSLNNRTGLRLSHQVSPGVRQGVQFTLLLGADAREVGALAKMAILPDFQ